MTPALRTEMSMGLFLRLSSLVGLPLPGPPEMERGAPPCQFSWVISSQKTTQDALDHKGAEPGPAAAGSQETGCRPECGHGPEASRGPQVQACETG